MANEIMIFVVVGMMFLLPVIVLVGGMFLHTKMKRQTKGLIKLTKGKYIFKNVDVMSKKVNANIKGGKSTWIIPENYQPYYIVTKFGLVPYYYCEVGKNSCSYMEATNDEDDITDKDINKIENQALLRTLMSGGAFASENLILLIAIFGSGLGMGVIGTAMVLGMKKGG